MAEAVRGLCYYFSPFTFTEMMFDGHEDLFFFQTTNQSRPRTDSLGKSNKGQNLDQNINERRIV